VFALILSISDGFGLDNAVEDGEFGPLGSTDTATLFGMGLGLGEPTGNGELGAAEAGEDAGELGFRSGPFPLWLEILDFIIAATLGKGLLFSKTGFTSLMSFSVWDKDDLDFDGGAVNEV
jgi:hypothetical protein